jgi:hypothetical protein
MQRRLFAALVAAVPPAWRGKLTVGARNGDRADGATVPSCKELYAYGWNLSFNSFWIDKPACAPIIVKTGRAKRTVHLRLGAPCP